jgi:hypothetical protein
MSPAPSIIESTGLTPRPAQGQPNGPDYPHLSSPSPFHRSLAPRAGNALLIPAYGRPVCVGGINRPAVASGMPVFPAEAPGINYGYLSRCIGMACPQPYSAGSTPISVRTRVPVAPETRCLFRPTSGRYAWAGINRLGRKERLAGVSGKSLHRLFTIHIAQMIGLGQAPILRVPASTDISLK